MTFEVRPARESDNEAIRAIYNEAVANTSATMDTIQRTPEAQAQWWKAHGPLHPVRVAEAADKSGGAGGILGFASLNRWSDKCGYDGSAELSIYVHASERSRGVGKQLLDEIIAAGRSAGLGVLISRITTESVQSIAMHDRVGFRRVGTQRASGFKFGRLMDIMLLELALKPVAAPPALLGVGHAQITVPRGAEEQAREFYCGFLGVPEIPKPESMRARGGLWLRIDSFEVHIGVEAAPENRSASKAHLAWEVRGLDAWKRRLSERGIAILDGMPLPGGIRRAEFRDPFGNRVEFYERETAR